MAVASQAAAYTERWKTNQEQVLVQLGHKAHFPKAKASLPFAFVNNTSVQQAKAAFMRPS